MMMSDSAKKLHKRVMVELKNQRSQKKSVNTVDERTKRFGIFIDVCLSNNGRSRADFANQLDLELELLNGILDGLLPESEIDDDLLVTFAQGIQHQPNVLRLLLGRNVQPEQVNKLSKDGHTSV